MKKLGIAAAVAFSLGAAAMLAGKGCEGCQHGLEEKLTKAAAELNTSNGSTTDNTNSTSPDSLTYDTSADASTYDTSADASNSVNAEVTQPVSDAMLRYNKLVRAGANPQDVGRVVCEYILATQPDKRLILSAKTARETMEELFYKMAGQVSVDTSATRESFASSMYQLGLQEPSHPLSGKATLVVNYQCEGGALLLK